MNEPLTSKTKVARWVTTWPYELQPTFGSSTIDWTKVEVVPAATYDALTAELQGTKDELYSVDKAAKELGAERDKAVDNFARLEGILYATEAERDRLLKRNGDYQIENLLKKDENARLRAALEHYSKACQNCGGKGFTFWYPYPERYREKKACTEPACTALAGAADFDPLASKDHDLARAASETDGAYPCKHGVPAFGHCEFCDSK